MKAKINMNVVGSSFEKHNHEICNEHYTNKMEKYCDENNLNLTPLRRKVFEILIRDHKPLGAYQILATLKKRGFCFFATYCLQSIGLLGREGICT